LIKRLCSAPFQSLALTMVLVLGAACGPAASGTAPATAPIAPPAPSLAESVAYTAIFGGKNVGHLTVQNKDGRTTVDWDVKNNGRGPTISETLTDGPGGLPSEWRITGTQTFGGKVDERHHPGCPLHHPER
jgi:hypothetical protein